MSSMVAWKTPPCAKDFRKHFVEHQLDTYVDARLPRDGCWIERRPAASTPQCAPVHARSRHIDPGETSIVRHVRHNGAVGLDGLMKCHGYPTRVDSPSRPSPTGLPKRACIQEEKTFCWGMYMYIYIHIYIYVYIYICMCVCATTRIHYIFSCKS